eukprot:6208215-Pleurochrysis_carterae.AAC.2
MLPEPVEGGLHIRAMDCLLHSATGSKPTRDHAKSTQVCLQPTNDALPTTTPSETNSVVLKSVDTELHTRPLQ